MWGLGNQKTSLLHLCFKKGYNTLGNFIFTDNTQKLCEVVLKLIYPDIVHKNVT